MPTWRIGFAPAGGLLGSYEDVAAANVAAANVAELESGGADVASGLERWRGDSLALGFPACEVGE